MKVETTQIEVEKLPQRMRNRNRWKVPEELYPKGKGKTCISTYYGKWNVN
jgi:hypothetical protein